MSRLSSTLSKVSITGQGTWSMSLRKASEIIERHDSLTLTENDGVSEIIHSSGSILKSSDQGPEGRVLFPFLSPNFKSHYPNAQIPCSPSGCLAQIFL